MRSLLLFLLCSMTLHAQSPVELVKAQLQDELDGLVLSDSLPGVCLSVVFNDDHQIHISSGYSNVKTKKEMLPQSRMMSGSTGKLLFASLVLKLVQSDSLSLNARVEEYMEAYPWYKAFPNADRITVRQLLNHTSGLQRHLFQDELLDRIAMNPGTLIPPVEAVQYLCGTEAVHEPGRGWSYSDANYILLGLIYEHITERDIYEDVHRLIFRPAGIADTTPSVTREMDGLVQGYIGTFNPFGIAAEALDARGMMKVHPGIEWTGGGYVTTTGDLAKAIRYIFESSMLTDSIKHARTSAVSIESGRPAHSGYGMGTFVWDKGRQSYGHYGFFPGYVSYVEYDPTDQYSLAIQINHDDATPAMQKLAGAVNQIIQDRMDSINVHLVKQNFRNQEACWNKGSHECYMQAYAPGEDIVTVSSAGVTHGYESILHNYKQYFPEGRMGHLYFDELEFRIIASDYCFAIGRFNLELPGRESLAQGYFSALCKKIKGKWYLITDHSS